ncbi:hypothetical protein CALCODRAFT_521584 [Calocera cornea HHB12733]|uniref:Uncharacterized protein n=1 Tax=Calocera cornea HHB12733 TaxID=1353952 RepID=A0A165CNE6_9BASI|nr:hypothetical protein CALCODRAFT_521584 [Calocera cornea HHB12733]
MFVYTPLVLAAAAAAAAVGSTIEHRQTQCTPPPGCPSTDNAGRAWCASWEEDGPQLACLYGAYDEGPNCDGATWCYYDWYTVEFVSGPSTCPSMALCDPNGL